MADLRDEHGNPIQLTDEHGNPVQLTDKYGNPMYLRGVATTEGDQSQSQIYGGGTPAAAAAEVHGGDDVEGQTRGDPGEHRELKQELEQERESEHHEQQGRDEIQRSTSSSSNSSEDDGQGGRRKKKKGLKEKIKEKLTGSGKHKEEHAHTVGITTTKTSITTPGQLQEHEKKSVMEKIKEKLSGHHSNH